MSFIFLPRLHHLRVVYPVVGAHATRHQHRPGFRLFHRSPHSVLRPNIRFLVYSFHPSLDWFVDTSLTHYLTYFSWIYRSSFESSHVSCTAGHSQDITNQGFAVHHITGRWCHRWSSSTLWVLRFIFWKQWSLTHPERTVTRDTRVHFGRPEIDCWPRNNLKGPPSPLTPPPLALFLDIIDGKEILPSFLVVVIFPPQMGEKTQETLRFLYKFTSSLFDQLSVALKDMTSLY